MRLFSAAVLLVLAALLAACSSGPPKRLFPPQASLQELRVLENGQWEAKIRIQNFSTVPMVFSRVEATLGIGGAEATRINLDPALSVGPGSIEVVSHAFTPTAGPAAAVQQALASRHSVRYQLTGRISSSEPASEHPFDYQSALDPVPGLTGVLR